MKKWSKAGVSLVASFAIAVSMTVAPVSAHALGGLSGSVGEETDWTVPSSKMNNTVTVDGKLHKVITTWANAWALSGPDYLGVSNSGPLNQQGGGAGSTTLADAKNNTLLGIWASSANEVPNAYNWNYFCNLSLSEEGEDTVDTAAVDVQNGSSPGFDTASGVWAPFKYRPEIIWTSNSLNASAVSTYTELIRDGKYYSSTAADPSTDEPAANADDYKIDGDDKYNPKVISAQNGTAYTFQQSFYDLAGLVEEVKSETASNASNVTEETVTWKNMNSLPRTTRYEASEENAVTAREAALDIEKVTRGSVYYTLSKIADGTVKKKKVAFLSGDPDATAGTATVAYYDFIDGIGGGQMNGKASYSTLTVDQLTGTNEQVVTDRFGNATKTYTVTADDLAACDFVVNTNGSMTTMQLTEWMFTNASTDALKQRATRRVEYLSQTPAIMNGHNFTTEKLIWGAYNISFFYPELWPNMELVTYWYDNVYHLKSDSVKTALTYGMANSSLPSDMELSDLGQDYSSKDIDSKAIAGYKYYQTIANTAPYNTDSFATLAPSETYAEWVKAEGNKSNDPIPNNGNNNNSSNNGDSNASKTPSVKAVTANTKTVTAKSLAAAVKAAGGDAKTVTSIELGSKVTTVSASAFKAFPKLKTVTLGKKVKSIKKNAFKGSKVTKVVVKSKKLTKKSVKGALKGSKVKTVQVKVGSKKANKKYVKKYKKIFTKKNAGKKATVK